MVSLRALHMYAADAQTECDHSEKSALVLESPWVLSNVKVLFLSASHRSALCHTAAGSFKHGGDVNVTCAV